MKVSLAAPSLLLVVLASGEALACMPPLPSEAMAKEYRNVIIGKIESRGFVQLKQDSTPEMLVKIERLEILSGNAPSTVTAVVPCAAPLQQGERVVVATFHGRRFAYPADMYEESFRAVHGRKR